jgi:multidrug efflux system membrane fusion protein
LYCYAGAQPQRVEVGHMDDQISRSYGDVTGVVKPRRTTRRRTRAVLAILIFAFLATGASYGFWRWREAQRPVRSATPPTQAVGAAVATKQDIRVVLSGLGTVTSLATVTAKTQIAGAIVDIGFKEGQLVKRGDFLVQIDPRPYQVALEQAEGALARDEALLKNAQLDLVRFQTLWKQDSIARQQVDTQAALVRQDEGTVKTDRAAVDSAQLNLAYCHIVSPVEGRVGLRLVDLGNYVQPTDTTGLVVIAQVTPISVIFTLPEDDIPQVVKALHAGRTLEPTSRTSRPANSPASTAKSTSPLGR